MTDHAKLDERLSQPEQSRSGTGRSVLLGTLVVAVVATLTVNVYLLSQQLTAISDNGRENAFWSLCHTGLTADQRAGCFLQLVAEGNTEWKSAILKDLDLAGMDLSTTQIESATFLSCDFSRANLSEAVLNKSGLDLSDLTGANLSKAKLRNATFFKSNLNEVDFRNAELLSASLEQATAHNANFVAAKMGDAFLAMTDLTGADLTGADLSGANLEAAILRDAELALANLYGTYLEDTDFTNSNWWRARGLDTQQLEVLTLKFPPTQKAPESRQRDFEIWLTKRISDSTSPQEKGE